jgi:hypothetical protein
MSEQIDQELDSLTSTVLTVVYIGGIIFAMFLFILWLYQDYLVYFPCTIQNTSKRFLDSRDPQMIMKNCIETQGKGGFLMI